jgi:hypothetical protein
MQALLGAACPFQAALCSNIARQIALQCSCQTSCCKERRMLLCTGAALCPRIPLRA